MIHRILEHRKKKEMIHGQEDNKKSITDQLRQKAGACNTGQEHGVPGYNIWREWCGLPRVQTFEELEHYLQNRTAFYSAKFYK